MRRPHKNKVVELPDGGITFPLKYEYDRANHSLEGVRRARPMSALDLPDNDDVTVRGVGKRGQMDNIWTTLDEDSRIA